MSHASSSQPQPKSKAKKWGVNLLILVMATILLLALAEGAMRWIDGYRLSTIELDQNNNTLPPTE